MTYAISVGKFPKDVASVILNLVKMTDGLSEGCSCLEYVEAFGQVPAKLQICTPYMYVPLSTMTPVCTLRVCVLAPGTTFSDGYR